MQIKDPKNGMVAEVVNHSEQNALCVATRELKTYDNKQQFFSNEIYGSQMNVAVEFSGTPINVHNGLDKIQWTATAIVGGNHWDPDDNNHHAKDAVINILDYSDLSGETITISVNEVVTVVTEGADYNAVISNEQTAINLAAFMTNITGIGATADGAVVTLLADDNYDIGADVDLANYSALTGWIYITKWLPTDIKEVEIELWQNGVIAEGTQKVGLGNYIDTTLLNQWQKFTIPLGSFNGVDSIIDSFRIRSVDIGAGQPNDYYLDFLQIQEIGTPQEYRIRPNKDTWLHIENFMFSIANSVASTVADGTVAGFDYNSFLGATLGSGIVYQRIQNGEVISSSVIKTLADWLSLPETKVSSQMSNGTNSFITMRGDFTDAIILKAEDNDELRIIVSEDLSSLLHLKISAGCKEEDRYNINN